MTATKPVHVVAGPTASGKSARALKLALAKNGVIVNADSLQLYDALPILTAQPTLADKAEVPHALYSVLPPQAVCSAARWRALAITAIETAHAAHQLPILTGGTGLYLNALLKGLSPMPDVPPAIRATAVARQQDLGNPGFHADLQARDPVMAARLHPNDTQRLIRAWEVFAATGQSLAIWQNETVIAPPAHYAFTIELILPERDDLYARCNQRFEAMLEMGVEAEIVALATQIDNGQIAENAAITGALGFRPLLAHSRGLLDRVTAITQAKTQTRQYAKRQTTWFRHQIPASLAIINLSNGMLLNDQCH